MELIIPEGYNSKLNLKETERAIKAIREYFVKNLSEKLNLMRVSAPLFVNSNSGLNDNLNGIERPVEFTLGEHENTKYEIVHSLAKWKRMALKRYNFSAGEGIYTDMNAIRRDENTDNLHSIYVDQFDWEKVITESDRTEEFLENTVKIIYEVLRQTEIFVCENYTKEKPILPENITFIASQELLDKYPDKSAKDRELLCVKEHKAVFLKQIGGVLSDGTVHDGRAPDYDDWQLNGDILLYYPVLDCTFEISSMGIRVNKAGLEKQLKLSACEDRAKLPFQNALLNDKLPQTIGGGIGQSRLCMFMLRKAHIGEVQSSVWTDETLEACENNDIEIL